MRKTDACLVLAVCFAIGGCASIESRGLAKCSGGERRPLNADLWQWSDQRPIAVEPASAAAPNLPAPSDGLVRKADFPAPGLPSTMTGYAPTKAGAGAEFETVLTPRWDVDASYANCESDVGADK